MQRFIHSLEKIGSSSGVSWEKLPEKSFCQDVANARIALLRKLADPETVSARNYDVIVYDKMLGEASPRMLQLRGLKTDLPREIVELREKANQLISPPATWEWGYNTNVSTNGGR